MGEISRVSTISKLVVVYSSSPGSTTRWRGDASRNTCNARHGSTGARVGWFGGVAKGGFWEKMGAWRERLGNEGGFCGRVGIWLPWLGARFAMARDTACPQPGEQSRGPVPNRQQRATNDYHRVVVQKRGPQRARGGEKNVCSSSSGGGCIWEKEPNKVLIELRLRSASAQQLTVAPCSRIVNQLGRQWPHPLAQISSETP